MNDALWQSSDVTDPLPLDLLIAATGTIDLQRRGRRDEAAARHLRRGRHGDMIGSKADCAALHAQIGHASHLHDLVVETSWRPTSGNMTSARSQHTTTLLPGGKVLITGGISHFRVGKRINEL